ncbi:IclR family transcriptional regulator [Saccharopolyspora sp. K220]|uniref:IclR family transcriptional regulator n=1 Tax=Saccharopolyspora soli TaxID=2926618 RepID=UPI001F562B53|nr:IclR family transcriptional regulator [Saccharopolyspora soli]MCI2422708.1 IclR family transcriptional regulator [Saccharopolyspora soli]
MGESGARGRGPAKQHRTVSRVTTILETVAADPHGVRLSVLAGALDAPKTSVHGLVKGLVANGYLQEHDGAYLLGPAVGALLASPGAPLVDAARPTMQELRAAFDETVMLATLVGDSVVYLETIESTQLIRYTAPLRKRRPIYPTSTGKCLLAHMAAADREAYLGEHFPDPAERAGVERELGDIVTEEVAYNRGETVPDVSAVASIVLAPRTTASVAIAGPTSRVADQLDEMAAAVRKAAQQITHRLR